MASAAATARQKATMASARARARGSPESEGTTTSCFQRRSECSRANSRERASRLPMRFTATRNASSVVSPASTRTALRNFPPRLDVAEPLEPMQNGVEHPVRPLHAPSGQLPNSLEDGVAVAVLFGQDRQHHRGRGSGYQVLVDLHDFTHRAALTNSNPLVHSSIIHTDVRYSKDRGFKEYGRGTFPDTPAHYQRAHAIHP